MAKEKEETKEEGKEVQQEYNLVEVPTHFGLAIQFPDGKAYSTDYAIVYLLNELSKLKKIVG